MFHEIFFSPQVKRCAIITYKHGIYELPHELPNDLRLRILGNIKKVLKPQESLQTLKPYSLVPSLSAKNKILLILAKTS